MALIGWLDDTTDLGSVWFDTLWPDAPEDEETLVRLLTSSYETCSAFAPVLADGAPVPERYKEAQVLQARAQARNAAAGPGDQVGPDGYTVTVYPMDRTIKAKLRPRSGKPVIL